MRRVKFRAVKKFLVAGENFTIRGWADRETKQLAITPNGAIL